MRTVRVARTAQRRRKARCRELRGTEWSIAAAELRSILLFLQTVVWAVFLFAEFMTTPTLSLLDFARCWDIEVYKNLFCRKRSIVLTSARFGLLLRSLNLNRPVGKVLPQLPALHCKKLLQASLAPQWLDLSGSSSGSDHYSTFPAKSFHLDPP